MRPMNPSHERGDAVPSRNIELKARLASLSAARTIAREIADTQLPDQHQIDTYFHCRTGRLKLREIVGVRAELIAYDRPDQASAKTSNYFVVPVLDPSVLREALTSTLSIRTRIEKRREIYLHRHVRIHLDHVTALGDFLEFEAVLGADSEDTDGDGANPLVAGSLALVDDLRCRFGISAADLIDCSYGDLAEVR